MYHVEEEYKLNPPPPKKSVGKLRARNFYRCPQGASPPLLFCYSAPSTYIMIHHGSSWRENKFHAFVRPSFLAWK